MHWILASALVLFLATSCSSAVMVDSSSGRSKIDSEGNTADPSQGVEAVDDKKPSNELAPPIGIEEAKSPFHERKIWMPASAMALTGSSSLIPVNIIYNKNVDCHLKVLQLPGDKKTQNFREVFDNEISAWLKVPSGFDFSELAAMPCLIGIAYDEVLEQEKPTGNPFSSFQLTDRAQDALRFGPEADAIAKAIDGKVKVAIIDTGLDLENDQFEAAISKDLRVTSHFRDAKSRQVIAGDNPQDEHGHGTAVASLIAHKSLGAIPNMVELIPIKVSQNGIASGADLLAGIAMAVNKEADIAVVTMSANTEGCHPSVGYALYKAREKGLMAIVSAGNGKRNAAGREIGFPVVGARDDGPATYGLTQSPACWARYFLGVVAAAAYNETTGDLADFSNYGDDIEISAPGVEVETVGLSDVSQLSSGTSFSAPYVAAAAALAIGHHRSKGFRFSPWYIENLLVESARKSDADGVERRVRFGSKLDFTFLASLLRKVETWTDEERRNKIRTINPRQGDGWKPGEDQANLRFIEVFLNKTIALPGEDLSYKAVAFFRHSDEMDITRNSNTRISISHPKLVKLNGQGKLTIAGVNDASYKPNVDEKVTITFNFDDHQAQAFTSVNLLIKGPTTPSPAEPKLTKVKVDGPKTPIRIGVRDNGPFKATAVYDDNSEVDVTGAATWSTSVTDEIRPTLAPGFFDSLDATAGKTYRIRAAFEGLTGDQLVLVEDETLSRSYIHSYLGQGGEIEKGQVVTLETRFVLSDTRERAVPATWKINGEIVNGGKKETQIKIDTSVLGHGSHTVTSISTFKKGADIRQVSSSYTFKVSDGIERIEIHLKQPVVSVDQEFQIDLRAYRKNNSYIVVTNDAQWTTSNMKMVSINKSGFGYAAKDAGNESYIITANYKGRSASIRLSVIYGSVITGSETGLKALAMALHPHGYCYRPTSSLTAHYEDGNQRQLSMQSTAFSEKLANNQYKDMILPLYGGKTYRVSATYNDGNAATGSGGGSGVVSSEIVMPVAPLNAIELHYENKVVAEPIVLFNNTYMSRVVFGTGVCEFQTVKVEPNIDGGLKAVVNTNMIDLNYINAKPGKYTVTAQAFYTGLGYDQELETRFEVIINEAELDHFVFERISNTGLLQKGLDRYGVEQYQATLFDREKRPLIFQKGDIELTLKAGNGAVIDVDKSTRHYIVEKGPGHFIHGGYPKGLNRRFSLQAFHPKSGLRSSAIAFKQLGSFESTYEVADAALPSTETPSEAAGERPMHSSCEAALKRKTQKAPFEEGAGTKSDPYLICTTTQFLAISPFCGKPATWCRDHFFELGSSLDFNGAKINPTKHMSAASFDGKGYTIANYVIVDSELVNVGLFAFAPRSVVNLTLRNPTIRGNFAVGALAGQFHDTATILKNVKVVGGVVWGLNYVGGLIGHVYLESAEDVGVYETEVRYEGVDAGGLFGRITNANGIFSSDGVDIRAVLKRCVMTGNVAPSGVPGSTENVGGIAGWVGGGVVMAGCINTGNVVALNNNMGRTKVGGLVGSMSSAAIVASEMRGNVVSTGSSVGGIAGEVSGSDAFRMNLEQIISTADLQDVSRTHYLRLEGIIKSRSSGGVWGGMSRKQLACIDRVVEIIGVGGGVECQGDIGNMVGGRSMVGGIVGLANEALLQDNEFTGTTRGINAVGGVAGYSTISNLVRNKVAGVVSASEGSTEYGSLIGFEDLLENKIRGRLDSNEVNSSANLPQWSIGRRGSLVEVEELSNVPGHYD